VRGRKREEEERGLVVERGGKRGEGVRREGAKGERVAE